MVRTTPPRPYDITEVFPELRAHQKPATRLHPRTGSPTAADSSIGGPLLWPADEPWPMCTDGDDHYVYELRKPAAIRREREIQAAAASRAFTDEERAELSDLDVAEPEEVVHQPVPMIPVAQLYRRDVPGFIGPDDADLFQLLWCPTGHADEDAPKLKLIWRRAADVDRPLPAAPEPPAVEETYLPNPCVVHPEQVVDLQDRELLPQDLQTRIAARAKDTGGPGYSAWSVVPGWKVGGFASCRMTGPVTMTCPACDTEMELLFTVGFGEWDQDGYWRPAEDPADSTDPLTGIVIGRGFDWHIFRCPVSFDHPFPALMQ